MGEIVQHVPGAVTRIGREFLWCLDQFPYRAMIRKLVQAPFFNHLCSISITVKFQKMENPLRWFEIYVADMHRAKFFYQRTFGFYFSKMDTRSWDVEMWSISTSENGKSFGALVWSRGLTPSGINSVVYFGSEDCALEEGIAAEVGGKIHKSKFAIGQYGFMSLIHDTEGNLIGIHSRK